MQKSVKRQVVQAENAAAEGGGFFPVFMCVFSTGKAWHDHALFGADHMSASHTVARMHRVRDARQERGVELICVCVDERYPVWLRENRKLKSDEAMREWWEMVSRIKVRAQP